MTKSIYDGSSLTSQPTADLRGGMLDTSLARRPLPGELDPFCQAYIIKPKPPLAGSSGSSALETTTVDSDSLKGRQYFQSSHLNISEYRVGKLLPPPVITGYCHGNNRTGNNLLAIMATTSWQKNGKNLLAKIETINYCCNKIWNLHI